MHILTRRVPAVLLLVAIVASSAALCGGWSQSAAERRACCERMAGECASVSADDCCAGGEQRQHAESVPAPLVPPVRATPFRPAMPSSQFALTTASVPMANGHDTYLLDSVFRI